MITYSHTFQTYIKDQNIVVSQFSLSPSLAHCIFFHTWVQVQKYKNGSLKHNYLLNLNFLQHIPIYLNRHSAMVCGTDVV